MQIDASNAQNFGFSYTTSSGKSLSLALYDNQSASYSQNNGSTTLSLRREYGFSFTYEGSQLTNTDIAEIQDAMSEVEPLINDFLQGSKLGELGIKDYIQSAMQIANVLPTPSDENALNATMDSLVSKFEQLLKQNQSGDTATNKAMLEDSKQLIDEILTRLQRQMRELLQEGENANLQNLQNKNLLGFYV